MEDVSELCTRAMLINHGRLLFDGSLPQLRTRYGEEELTGAMRRAFAAMDLETEPNA
jgi:ABC-type uncharacterized transport system ATPase subunit